MVVLKKIKSSTLMETLVATVLIVIIFMMSSMILNTIFSNTIKNNTRAIDSHLNELQYLQNNDKLELPYQEVFGKWQIMVTEFAQNNSTRVEFEAINSDTNKTITIEQINIE
ncbi:hypothetical protein [Psychroserpens luteolus]|uniref:hypothetical protein n=1 Tax=Psychroserpens luteolus TaxID=2855840 RepID=UPI001E2A4CD8|nr:hypothetical protein [Psychroserpens luteolus]MCD2260792.1 hypothetical protein [Psychroserpens luteolus]